jgi:hypothetical protein
VDSIDWSTIEFREVLFPGGWYGPEKLTEVLFASAGYHARAALEDYTRTDERHVDAGFHCGTAVEHLSMAYLASLHPALIADGRDFDSLLILTGHPQHARRSHGSDVRTVGLADACARVKQVFPTFRCTDTDLRVLSSVRNAAAHLGVSRNDDIRRAVQVMVILMTPLLAALGKEPGEFWQSFINLAGVLRDEAVAEIDRVVASKLEAARALISQRLGGLGEKERAVVLAAISGKVSWTQEEEHPHRCPVCAQTGWLICQLDADDTDTQPDDDGNELPHVFALVDGFYCSACELSLTDGDETRAAGLPEEIDRGYRLIPYE